MPAAALPYVVRHRRYHPAPYLILAVGIVIAWTALTRSEDGAGAVLGVIGGAVVTVIGAAAAWAAVRRALVLAVERDGIVLGRKLVPWAQVAAVQNFVAYGEVNSEGPTSSQEVVQVRLTDGSVEDTLIGDARFDPGKFRAAVLACADPHTPVDITSGADRWPASSSIPGPLDAPPLVREWLRERRRGGPTA